MGLLRKWRVPVQKNNKKTKKTWLQWWTRGGDEEAGGGLGGRGRGWGGTFFWGYVLDMRQPLQEHGTQGLFDVEIGQFESVSFNFSQLTGPPWVPHIALIGYKLVFFCPLTTSVLKPLFLVFFYTLLRYPCWVFFLQRVLPLPHWMELQFHPRCLSVSHQHKTSLMLPLRHLLYSERHVLSAARLVFKTNKQNNGTTDLSSQFRHHIFVVVISVCFAFAVKIK